MCAKFSLCFCLLNSLLIEPCQPLSNAIFHKKSPAVKQGFCFYLIDKMAESERFELSQDCYTLTDQQSAALPLCQLSIAEDEGLEPPRPRGRRFSRPVSYQLELILQNLLENVFNRCKRLLVRWENYYGIISPYKKQIKKKGANYAPFFRFN